MRRRQSDRAKLRRVRPVGRWSFPEAARVGEAPQLRSAVEMWSEPRGPAAGAEGSLWGKVELRRVQILKLERTSNGGGGGR